MTLVQQQQQGGRQPQQQRPPADPLVTDAVNALNAITSHAQAQTFVAQTTIAMHEHLKDAVAALINEKLRLQSALAEAQNRIQALEKKKEEGSQPAAPTS